MINVQMAEVKNGFAVLEDVDQGTLERFIEWAYTGYYTAGRCIVDASDPSATAPSNQEKHEATQSAQQVPLWNLNPRPTAAESTRGLGSPADKEDSWGFSRKSKKTNKAKTSRKLNEAFPHREYMVRREVISLPPTRANGGVNEDYTEVFLSHARMYVFADKYFIQDLKTLALEELHQTLASFNLYPERTGDIVALLRYVYLNTSPPTNDGENLQTLLRDYVEYKMSALMKDEEFKDLLIEDGGPLLRDFITMVAKRID